MGREQRGSESVGSMGNYHVSGREVFADLDASREAAVEKKGVEVTTESWKDWGPFLVMMVVQVNKNVMAMTMSS